jgi:hypothetical protein
MASLKFKLDLTKAQSQVAGMYKRLSAEQIPAACSAAINRTLTEGRTSIVRALSTELTLKVGSIREVVSIRKVDKKAVAAGLSGHITLSDSARPLYDFPHREGKRGISVRVRKGKPPEKYRHWFVAKMKSGHVGIFGRAKGRDKSGGRFGFTGTGNQKRFMYTGGQTSVGKVIGRGKKKKLSGAGYARRLPIKEAFGPSVTAVFANAGTIAQKEVDKLGDTLAKNINSQIARFTKRKKT